jgi:hypothetical protein
MISTDGTSGVTVGGQAVAGSSAEVAITAKHSYRFEARDPQGNLKWVVEGDNIIPTVGLNEILDKFYKGSAYTAAHYVGLTDGTPTVNAADTMASHAGWAEVTAYDEAARQAATWGSVSAGSVSNSASKAVFTISANSTTIGGGFLVTDDTKGGTSGVLVSVVAFSAGDKTLDDGDTLSVTVTATMASA